MTHAQIAEHMKALHPGVRGFSLRSMERFCSLNGIHKSSRPSDEELDDAVIDAVAQVTLVKFGLLNFIYY